jgi:hypothetical protein
MEGFVYFGWKIESVSSAKIAIIANYELAQVRKQLACDLT